VCVEPILVGDATNIGHESVELVLAGSEKN